MFTSADPEHVTQHAVVYGFSFGPNAYFVGSARRPILPKKVILLVIPDILKSGGFQFLSILGNTE